MTARYVKLWVDLWDRIGNPMAYLLFVYLLQRAEYKDNAKCCRGQVLTSWQALGVAMGVPSTTVRRLFEYLESLELVGKQSGKLGTVISVYGYDSYNGGAENVASKVATSEEEYIYISAMEDLDQHLGTNFATRKVAKWRGFFNSRRKEGASLDDFRAVHALKVKDWRGTDMAKFLNPETLYRPSNFWKYHAAATATKKKAVSVGVDDLL